MSLLEQIEVSGTAPQPARVLFELLSDYRRIDSVIDGLEPLSPLTGDEAAPRRFASHMAIAGRLHRVELHLAELRPPSLVTWAGLGGDDRSVSFRLAEEESGTKVVIVTRYPSPQGLAGTFTRPLVAATIRERAERTLRLLASPPG